MAALLQQLVLLAREQLEKLVLALTATKRATKRRFPCLQQLREAQQFLRSNSFWRVAGVSVVAAF